jgi:thiamine transporter 2/3
LFLNFIHSAEVAKNIGEDSYGLIFGVNTFIALALQSVLTLIVVSDVGMALKIRTQVSIGALWFILAKEWRLGEQLYLFSVTFFMHTPLTRKE